MSNMQLDNNTNPGGTIELTSEVINQIRDIVVDIAAIVAGNGSELSVTPKQRDKLKALLRVRIQDDAVMIGCPMGRLRLLQLNDKDFYPTIFNALTNHVGTIEQGISIKLQDIPECREKNIQIDLTWKLS